MMKKLLAKTYIWILLILLYVPIIFIAVFSFTEAKTLGNWTGFSLELYKNIFTGGVGGGASLMAAIKNTLVIALIAAAVSTILGTVSAIGIFNLRGRKKNTTCTSRRVISPSSWHTSLSAPLMWFSA